MTTPRRRAARLLGAFWLAGMGFAAHPQFQGAQPPYNGLQTKYLTSGAFYGSPGYTFTPSRTFDNGVQFSIVTVGAAYPTWSIDMAAPNQKPLTVGLYENATRWPFQAADAPGFDYSGNGSGCNTSQDTFAVREAVYNGDGSVKSFAADFEQSCGNPLQYGELRYNSSIPFTSALSTPWRTDVSLPRKVDFNGDGKEDLLLKFPYGSYTVDLMDGVNVLESTVVIPNNSGLVVLRTGDFNGDGKTDLVVQRFDTSVEIWLMDGSTVTETKSVMPAGRGWVVSHIGDFNGDGKDDLVWTNIYDGSVGVWLMDGTSQLARATMLAPHSYYAPMGVGDFDGDGKSDILWRNFVDGTTSVWLMDGLTIREKGPIMNATNAWIAVALGDFDGDGKTDILWHNRMDNSTSMWLMDGRTVRERGSINPGSLTPLFVADLNGDGKSDILWTGAAYTATFMNGRSTIGHGTVSTAYSLAPALLRDVNGDGKADLILYDNANSYEGYGMRVQLLDGYTAGASASMPTYLPHLGSEFLH